VRENSARTIGMSGAIANQPKKQVKKAIHVMWKVRMGAERKSASRIREALSSCFKTVVPGV